MPVRDTRVGRVGVIRAPVAKTAVVAKAVTPARRQLQKRPWSLLRSRLVVGASDYLNASLCASRLRFVWPKKGAVGDATREVASVPAPEAQVIAVTSRLPRMASLRRP